MDSNDLIRRIAAATGARVNAYDGGNEYSSSYTGNSWGRAVGGTAGAVAAQVLAGLARKHQGVLIGTALVSMATVASAVFAQAMARAMASPLLAIVGYVVMVTISGIVAAMAVNALGYPVEMSFY